MRESQVPVGDCLKKQGRCLTFSIDYCQRVIHGIGCPRVTIFCEILGNNTLKKETLYGSIQVIYLQMPLIEFLLYLGAQIGIIIQMVLSISSNNSLKYVFNYLLLLNQRDRHIGSNKLRCKVIKIDIKLSFWPKNVCYQSPGNIIFILDMDFLNNRKKPVLRH